MARSFPGMVQRALRGAAFLFGLALGTAVSVFAYSNRGQVDVSWWRFHFGTVAVAYIVLLPLLIGIVAGYLYHLPARLHHFTEHMRHRARVRELERENRELKSTVEALLEMPDDSRPVAIAAAAPRALPPAANPRPRRSGTRDAKVVSAPVVIAEAAGSEEPAVAPATEEPPAATHRRRQPRRSPSAAATA